MRSKKMTYVLNSDLIRKLLQPLWFNWVDLPLVIAEFGIIC